MRPCYRVFKSALLHVKVRYHSMRSSCRVIIGACTTAQSGWIATDVDLVNLLDDKTWGRYFDEQSIEALLAEHVFEHLTVVEGQLAARNCLTYLKPSGYIRVAVPDGYFPDLEYREAVKPLGSGLGSDDHKVLYTYKTLSDLFRGSGFKVKLLEYWDENGQFHYTPWNSEEGFVRRSRWHDDRNNETEIRYTSLILDAVKP